MARLARKERKKVHRTRGSLNRRKVTRKKAQFHACDECGNSYTTTGSLNRHKLTHKQDRNYECHDCGKKYAYKDTLARHITLKHEITVAEKLADSLNCHQETNENVQNYECNECGKKYAYKDTLHRHIALKHNNTASKTFECAECGKKCDLKYNLKRHIFFKHSVRKKSDKSFECPECGKKYSQKCNLKFHINTLHSKNIECNQCNQKYRTKGDLKWHIYSTHLPHKTRIERRAFTCLLCSKSLSSEFHILNHFKNDHELEIVIENHTFENEQKFTKWKCDVEKQQRCTYIKVNGGYKNANTNKTTNFFRCNRSGFYTPPQSRQRKLKMQGSKKLNGFCPSKMVVHVTGDTFYEVIFTKSHIGHGNDFKELAHMNYSREVKDIIASKLIAGIPTTQIIADLVPATAAKPKDSVDKIDLLNSKDIHNIAASKNINIKNPDRHHPSEAIGDEAWVADNKESVYFYKRRDEVDQSEHGLHDDDYVLVFLKTEHVEKFERYSSNVILVEGTRGVSKKANFLLYALVVLDEYGQGYPACFLITNRNDSLVLDIMFSCIRDKFGVVRPRVLMSDTQLSYWNSWVRIMGIDPEYHFFCAWHVIRAWQKNYADVKSSEKKKAISERLLKLLYEDDVDSFHHAITEFINDDDEDLQSFIHYFCGTYASNYEKWAYCYQRHAGINTNMYIERFHGILNYREGRGLTIDQVQDTLVLLEKALSNRAYADIRTEVMGGKISAKIEAARRNHTKAVSNVDSNSYQITKIHDGFWIIVSWGKDVDDKHKEDRKEPRWYLLEKIKDDCPDCPMLCADCYFCGHQFRCSCQQNAIRNIMCKHIHQLCLTELLQIQTIYEVVSNTTDYTETDIIVEPAPSKEESIWEPLSNEEFLPLLSNEEYLRPLSAEEFYPSLSTEEFHPSPSTEEFHPSPSTEEFHPSPSNEESASIDESVRAKLEEVAEEACTNPVIYELVKKFLKTVDEVKKSQSMGVDLTTIDCHFDETVTFLIYEEAQ